MKKFKIKRLVALLVSAVAMLMANMSSSMCLFLFFDEEKMPKSLVRK